MTKVTEPSSLDKGQRPRKTRRCIACLEQVPDMGAPLCDPCWAELKTFRRYLREVLGKAPIHGDVPPNEQGVRFRIWPSGEGGRVPIRGGRASSGAASRLYRRQHEGDR